MQVHHGASILGGADTPDTPAFRRGRFVTSCGNHWLGKSSASIGGWELAESGLKVGVSGVTIILCMVYGLNSRVSYIIACSIGAVEEPTNPQP